MNTIPPDKYFVYLFAMKHKNVIPPIAHLRFCYIDVCHISGQLIIHIGVRSKT